MATFRFGRDVNMKWNGNEIVGPAGTIFRIEDAYYDEFNNSVGHAEPTLEWLVTNELAVVQANVAGLPVSATAPISATTTTAGTNISLAVGTTPANYVLASDGAGGASFIAAAGAGVSSITGTSPIAASASTGAVTLSLNANYSTSTHLHDGTYQPAGTYVTSVAGTSPITTSGTTAITVGIDQAAITGATAATNSEVVRVYVKNTTGTTIPKGSVVYVSGATGDNALISLSSASSESTSSKTLGFTASAITNDGFGYVIESGLISGVNTSAATAGQAVWLGNTPGSFIFGSPPAEPSHSVYLGVVIRVQSNNGEILVKVQNGYELDELHNVSVASPSDGDIVQYKTSSSLWTKSSIAGAGIAASTHTHAYQAAGTYVTAVNGTAPITSSTDTAGIVTVGLSASYASSVHTHATSDVTSGNFVATLAAGTGVTVTGADANAAAKTVSIGQAVATSSNVSFNNVNINGENSLWVSRASVASSAQSLTNNTSTTILLDTASTTPTTGTYDPKSWFNNANDRIVIGQDGFYAVSANIAFAANTTGRRTLNIIVNGADAGGIQVLASPAGSTVLSSSTNLYLAAGDLVTMTALQQSGGALNTVVVAGVYPALSVGRIGA
jgi:hypothetical protein